jgi:hypothetical protein
VETDVCGIKMNEDHRRTVRLPEAAVCESRDRVRSALNNCGYDILEGRSRFVWRQPTSASKGRASIHRWRPASSAPTEV